MEIEFTKMHGLGNDFIVFEAPSHSRIDPHRIKQLACRKTGVGFDQALIVEPPRHSGSLFYYRIFNSDGSEVEQCGNGARCLAYWASRRQGQFNNRWLMDSPAGLIEGLSDELGWASVDMGVPRFTPQAVPFVADREELIYPVEVNGQSIKLSIACLGNPHGVVVVEDINQAPIETIGPLLEAHSRFPNKANIGFMQRVDESHINLRVFERGVGETQACGTGACAAVAVGRRLGLLGPSVTVQLPGGQVQVNWPGEGERLWLSGPTAQVFVGTIEI
jgi:diaminopimelate epimerase